MNNQLLTIAIPTYNRARLLEKCLATLAKQLVAVSNQVEVIVSNNASTDDTHEIVLRYQQLIPQLKYNVNNQNIGADLNIAKCFELAESKYVWVFSDDDILIADTLQPILTTLANNDLGLLYVTPTWYVIDEADANIPDEPFTCVFYSNNLDFIKKVHYWTTFITGNIINKSLVKESGSLYQFKNTSLIQLGWTLPAVFKATVNAAVTSYVVVGRAAEGVNYRFFEVFSKNLDNILSVLVKDGQIPLEARHIINQKLITQFFPPSLVLGRKFSPGEKPFAVLFKAFKGYPEFWRVLVPAFIMPGINNKYLKFKSRIKRIILSGFAKLASASSVAETQDNIRKLRLFGVDSQLPRVHGFVNPQFISIGRRFRAQDNFRIEVSATNPEAQVVIGDDVRLGNDCQMSCIAGITIGNKTVVGNKVIISDSAFDDSPLARELSPAKRKLVSRGPIVIGANVLIEDAAIIRSGVHIGDYAIIRAGIIVDSDVVAYGVVGGNPVVESAASTIAIDA